MWCVQIDENGKCVAFLSPPPEDMTNFVLIGDFDISYIWRTYDRATQTWSDPVYP